MKEFIFGLSTKVMFGKGTINNIGEICRKMEVTKVLLVTGRTSTKKSPYLPLIIQSMEEAGILVKLFAEIEADPSADTVNRGVLELKGFGADGIVVFGGGSPMDAGKCMAMLAKNEGMILHYLHGQCKIKVRSIPLICIPTTAGTGSEVTATAVITDREQHVKMGISHDYLIPALAIVDPQVQLSMPPKVTAATGIDALTHAIEAYIGKRAEPISDALALQAIQLIGNNLRQAYSCGSDIEARSNMAIASLMAGGAFANAGLGAVHAIARPIGAQFGIAHGVANAIVLPHVMDYFSGTLCFKFRNIATAVGADVQGLSDIEVNKQLAMAIKKMNKDIGIPPSLAAVGIPESAKPALVKDALTYKMLPNSPKLLTGDNINMILAEAFR